MLPSGLTAPARRASPRKSEWFQQGAEKGEGIAAFVTLKGGVEESASLSDELSAHVVKEIGKIARPDKIRFAEALPKTRSGKIMRRLLREIAAGREQAGDTSTLEDRSVLEQLRAAEV